MTLYSLKTPLYNSINLKCVFLLFLPSHLTENKELSPLPSTHQSLFLFPAVLSTASPLAACSGRCKGFTLLIFPKQTLQWLKATGRGVEHEHGSQGASWPSHYSPCPRKDPLWVTVWTFIKAEGPSHHSPSSSTDRGVTGCVENFHLSEMLNTITLK